MENLIIKLNSLIRENEGNIIACKQFKAPDYFYDLLLLEQTVFKSAILGLKKAKNQELEKIEKEALNFIEGIHYKIFKKKLNKFLFDNCGFN